MKADVEDAVARTQEPLNDARYRQRAHQARSHFLVLGDPRFPFYRRHAGAGARDSQRLDGKYRADRRSPDREPHRLRCGHSVHSDSTCRLWRDPKRQQIIVFRAPLPEEGYPDFIKRCIGVPGDRIKIIAGQVYVNGSSAEGALRAARSGCRGCAGRKFSARAGRSRVARPDAAAMGRGSGVARGERRAGGAARRLFHDGRQSRQFVRQPLLGLRAARRILSARR